MDEVVKVSIICCAYNHEKYIEKTLHGFLMQKTNFIFEVIIHDDASTDLTEKIIRAYQSRFPHIIKPIFQKENQYSQGKNIIEEFIYPRINGKYVAICEGDDYWIDENKLQIQFDILEMHPEYSACCHDSYVHNCHTNRDYKNINIKQNKRISVDEVIGAGGGRFSTNSFFCKKEIFTKRPDCFYHPSIGDYQLAIYSSINGLFYIGKCMSVYNYLTEGSWSIRHDTAEQKKRDVLFLIQMLKKTDIFYHKKYTLIINFAISKLEFGILLRDQKFEECMNPVFTPILLSLPHKTRFKIWLGKNHPDCLKEILKVKNFFTSKVFSHF